MKKALGQTVRDIKREVNKKVLKVPSIEQKVLDATSNEPWGPHGSLLSDIAQATRNYHEYQMIMTVIWKRINDTGKNWRHVYKALTVLEYLVAHGSERVIDEIKEHAYQISTLSDFQYVDSSGRDQGSNVRKKSQALVGFVNDKERIQEARQKAAANREKFRGPYSTGGMYKPSPHSGYGGSGDRFDEDRYDDRSSYEREREWGSREDDRYGRNGDPYGRDSDRYSRDSDERNARDGYRDDDLRGRSQSIDDYRCGSRSRSSDRGRVCEDDGQSTSRGSMRAENQSQDSRRLDRKFSEQNLGAPPSYEECVSDARSPAHSDRDGDNSAPPPIPPPHASVDPGEPTLTSATSAFPVNQEFEAFDEFDPRGSVTAAATTSVGAETDLLGSLSEPFSSNPLAIMPSASGPTFSEADATVNPGPEPTFAAASPSSSVMNQPFDDPFGDSPFKAVPSTDNALAQPLTCAPTASFQPSMNNAEFSHPVASNVDITPGFDFGEALPSRSYNPSPVPSAQSPPVAPDPPAQLRNADILAGILPPLGPSHAFSSSTPFTSPTDQPAPYGAHPTAATSPTYQPLQPSSNVFGSFGSQAASIPQNASSQVAPQAQANPASHHYNGQMVLQTQPSFGPQAPSIPQNAALHSPTSQYYNESSILSTAQMGLPMPPQVASQHHLSGAVPQQDALTLPASTGALALVPKPSSQDKFDTKSTVWADTLSRGLVNLNISGAKINPLADIGIDFDAINRKEKRMEKPSAAPATSNVTMGKAMGSGSGVGRSVTGALRPSSNPMMIPGTGMGMGGGLGVGMGMGRGMGMGGGGPGMGTGANPGLGLGGGGLVLGMGIGPNPGMGMGAGPGMGMGMGAGPGLGMGVGGYGGMNQQPMGMGMGQGGQMQPPPTGPPPGGFGYDPVTGSGYSAQQPPYGGGCR